MKISQKSRIEWGYRTGDDGEWIVVDKKILEEAPVPDGIEKRIGFEGTPDPNSGFCCYYNEGRLVNADKDVTQPSKWLGKAEAK